MPPYRKSSIETTLAKSLSTVLARLACRRYLRVHWWTQNVTADVRPPGVSALRAVP